MRDCEIVRDYVTGEGLNYAFVEFTSRSACEEAYRKMDGVLIDDRRVKVDFSQSVAKLWNKFTARSNKDQRGSRRANEELGHTPGRRELDDNHCNRLNSHLRGPAVLSESSMYGSKGGRANEQRHRHSKQRCKGSRDRKVHFFKNPDRSGAGVAINLKPHQDLWAHQKRNSRGDGGGNYDDDDDKEWDYDACFQFDGDDDAAEEAVGRLPPEKRARMREWDEDRDRDMQVGAVGKNVSTFTSRALTFV